MQSSCRSLLKPVKDRPGDERNPSEATSTKNQESVPDQWPLMLRERAKFSASGVCDSALDELKGRQFGAGTETRFSDRTNLKTEEPVKAKRV